MSKSNGSLGGPDIMVVSTPDIMGLLAAVQERWDKLHDAFLRIRGFELKPPKSLNPDVLKCANMKLRHNCGDFRNTLSEYKALKAVAEWTHRENCILRNQKFTKIHWKD
jgi:hypothetical protein